MATLYYESSFAHHGIKGQKWGVRRFQNSDGTLTKAGKKRLVKLQKMSNADYSNVRSDSRSLIDSAILNSSQFTKASDEIVESAKKLESLEDQLSVIRTDQSLRKNEATEYAYRYRLSGMDEWPDEKGINKIIDYYMNGEGSREMESHWAESSGIVPDGKSLFSYRFSLYNDMYKASKNIASTIMDQMGGTKLNDVGETVFDRDVTEAMTKAMAQKAFTDDYLKKYRNGMLIP